MSSEAEGQRLVGRVALVTGGGGANSIGRSIALRLGREGAKVGVLDVNEAGAAFVAGEIGAVGGEATPVTCDVTDLEQCEAAVKLVADTYGGTIDILVNNAAAFGGFVSRGNFRSFDQWSTEDWDHMMDVNVRGMWFCARAVHPYMQRQGYGKIINLASNSFWGGVPGFLHYVSSKGGVIGFTRALARELGPEGIRVNALAPGFTLSGANMEEVDAPPEHWEATRKGQCLSERNELPEDLAGPAFFLASPDSDFMSGQALVVDGGLYHN